MYPKDFPSRFRSVARTLITIRDGYLASIQRIAGIEFHNISLSATHIYDQIAVQAVEPDPVKSVTIVVSGAQKVIDTANKAIFFKMKNRLSGHPRTAGL